MSVFSKFLQGSRLIRQTVGLKVCAHELAPRQSHALQQRQRGGEVVLVDNLSTARGLRGA